MNRNEIEIKITEALDGTLGPDELDALHAALEGHPDLKEAFELLREPVNLKQAFPDTRPDPARIQILKDKLNPGFSEMVVEWFPKYLAAAGLAALVMIGIARQQPQTEPVTDEQVFEWLYAADEQLAYEDFENMLPPEVFLQNDN